MVIKHIKNLEHERAEAKCDSIVYLWNCKARFLTDLSLFSGSNARPFSLRADTMFEMSIELSAAALHTRLGKKNRRACTENKHFVAQVQCNMSSFNGFVEEFLILHLYTFWWIALNLQNSPCKFPPNVKKRRSKQKIVPSTTVGFVFCLRSKKSQFPSLYHKFFLDSY